MASVGFSVDGQPFVIPTLYGRSESTLYFHGSAASRMMKQLSTGISACATVTLTDSLVLARSAFHHSMNYRSVVAFGVAQLVSDPAEKRQALEVISEHLIPGRWSEVRAPSDKELKATAVIRFTIEEASAKVRTGPAADDEEDYVMPVWAGVLPLALQPGEAVPDARICVNPEPPQYIRNYATRLAR